VRALAISAPAAPGGSHLSSAVFRFEPPLHGDCCRRVSTPWERRCIRLFHDVLGGAQMLQCSEFDSDTRSHRGEQHMAVAVKPLGTAGASGQRAKMSNVRWGMIALCFAATTINFIDRSNLGVAAPFIQRDLRLSPTATGFILGAFFWTYAVMQMPSGYLVDRFGPRLMYTIAVGWWSIFTTTTALARTLSALFGFRLALGIGEAAAYPAPTPKSYRCGFRAANVCWRPASSTAGRGWAPRFRCRS
jgi:hypothetical protein